MSVVTLDGGMLHYEVLGRGRPLIFLHGWVGSWRYWIPTMQAASIGFRTYALDLWGFGDTARNSSLYTIEQQTRLLDSFMDTMGIGKIALVGHGLGAIVAMSFAVQNPRLVDRILLNCLPLSPTSINSRLRIAPIDELVEWLLASLPTTEAARAEAPRADPAALQVSLDSLLNISVLDLLQTMTTPCLLVYGQNDPAVEFPRPEMLAKFPEQSHYVVFEQSGHFPMLDEPTQYNRLLGDFLALASGESPRQLQLKEEWKRRVR
jgi:pimeloyl-ACP methyl ester carboxylesterase